MAQDPEQIALFIVRASVDRTVGRTRFRITSSTDVERRSPETKLVGEERIAEELRAWIGSVRSRGQQPDRIVPP